MNNDITSLIVPGSVSIRIAKVPKRAFKYRAEFISNNSPAGIALRFAYEADGRWPKLFVGSEILLHNLSDAETAAAWLSTGRTEAQWREEAWNHGRAEWQQYYADFPGLEIPLPRWQVGKSRTYRDALGDAAAV